ncbi:MAG: hypothetical protein JST84_06655 [Acidobacteria bacterium]|nr:hypothetical protein [Acidobacteriota bacterium]
MNFFTISRNFASCVLLLLVSTNTPFSQIRAKEERVHFARGKSSALLKGTTPKPSVGDFDQYILDARARQTLTVRLKTTDTKAYVLIYGLDLNPSNDCLTCHQGDRLRTWAGKLPADGAYSLQVYTDSKGGVPYTLEVSIR